MCFLAALLSLEIYAKQEFILKSDIVRSEVVFEEITGFFERDGSTEIRENGL